MLFNPDFYPTTAMPVRRIIFMLAYVLCIVWLPGFAMNGAFHHIKNLIQ